MEENVKRMRVWALLLVAIGAACSNDSTGPKPGDTVGPTQLHIVRQDAAAPQLQAYAASFWAVKGTSRTLEIDYLGGEDFFRLDVPGDALLRRPDGSTIQQGDSVLISVEIDPSLMLFRFEPSGLVFDGAHPVRLRVDYSNADDDFDEDGDVDTDDDAIEGTWLSVWRQPASGTNWVRLASARDASLEDFEAELVQFSNYALAW